MRLTAAMVALLAVSDVTPRELEPRAPGGTVLFEVPEGPFAVPAGDIDADGVPDIAVSNHSFGGDCPARAHTLKLYSGRTGTVLRALTGELGFAARLAPAGDIDADGCPDLLVWTVDEIWPPPIDVVFFGQRLCHVLPTRLAAYSGRTGDVIRKLESDGLTGAFTGLGDVDGDRHADFAVTQTTGQDLVDCSARSGRDGAELWKYSVGAAGYNPRLLDLASIGDLDADGVDDLAFTAPCPSHEGHSALHVLSARHGSLLMTWEDSVVTGNSAPVAVGVGDLDGDTVPDILVGGEETGEALVISGLDGAVIHRVAGDAPDDDFGFSVAGLDDLDGDGLPEFAVGARHFFGYDGCAYVRIFSGRDARTLLTIDGSTEDGSGGPMDIVGVPHGFGTCFSPLGDINGDGCLDLLVGEDRYTNMGGYDGDRVVIVSACIEPGQPPMRR